MNNKHIKLVIQCKSSGVKSPYHFHYVWSPVCQHLLV